MNPIDKRAIAESKKTDAYAVVQKIWGKYSVIPRKTKKDAMATYKAAKGLKTAVAYKGQIIAGAVDRIGSDKLRTKADRLCASDVDGKTAEMMLNHSDRSITVVLPDSLISAPAPEMLLYLTDLQRFIDIARQALLDIREDN